ncbi:MAG: Peptidase U32 [Elusimicrobia bacterium]|nr:MAG: Peptidase U32 [Elusimicrobiota bacterium]KAF0157969.1 MAG: Peptidase U32 [Elusimicrobiota bacterium]
MRLLSCITDRREIPVFRKLGVDEVYFAVGDVPNYANTGALGAAADAPGTIRAAHAHGLKVFLAANGREDRMRDPDREVLVKKIRAIAAAGLDGLIVSNPGLFRLFAGEKIGVPLHLSSVQPCFNSGTARFFVERFGISRIILPNQLAAAEAAGILRYCRSAGVETEIFCYKFFGCPYINGACYLHEPEYYTLSGPQREDGMCRMGSGGSLAKVSPYRVFERDAGTIARTAARLSLRFSRGGAPRLLNASSFFDYCLAGVDCVKYGTRTDGTEAKIRNLRAIREMLRAVSDLAGRFPPEEARRRFVERAGSYGEGT